MKTNTLNKVALLVMLACFGNAQAASLLISETPMAVKNTVKSNIMFTLDNSGGTDVDVLLTTFNSMYYESGVTPGNSPYVLNGHFYLLPDWYRENNGLAVATESHMLQGDLNSPDVNDWVVRNNQGNPQYYSPFKVYLPWPGTDTNGTAFANANPAYALISPPYWANVAYSRALDLTKELASNVSNSTSIWRPAASSYLTWTPPQAHTYLPIGGKVTGIEVGSAGSGYTSAPTVTISGGGGSGATATSTISSGMVTAINVTAQGSGYTSAPTVTLSGGGGSGATALVSAYYDSKWYPASYYNWVDAAQYVSSITVTNGGSGYTTAPTVTISGGLGSGATATANLTNGVVTSITVTAPGTGYASYTTLPTVTIGVPPSGGTQATATANIGGNGVLDAGEGVRYEIRNPSVSCTPTDPTAKIPGCTPACASTVTAPFTGCHPATYPNGNSYAQEIQNFANWFQYYRTPLLSLQGALGKQVETLGGANVGLVNLQSKITSSYTTPSSANWSNTFNPGTTPHALPDFFGTVQDMSAGARGATAIAAGAPDNITLLRNSLYAIEAVLSDASPYYGWHQPIHERMNLVTSYFQESTAVNGHNTPKSDGSAGPPIQYSCQQNFNVIATPGYLNENGSGAVGFQNYYTGVTPAAISTANYDGSKGVPYADTYSGTANGLQGGTLADWTSYIYDLNLRGSRTDLTDGQVPLTPSAHEDNPNLHLTTYVVAPGAQPTLQSSGRTNSITGLLEKINPMTADPWTISPSITWPQPYYVDQTTVDDLWHAAVNGRGKFVNDTDTYGGLKTVLNDIFGRVGASAAVAVSNANITPGDNFSYASSYNSGNWTGDLQSYAIDLTTGQASTTPRWVPSAQAALDTMVQTTTRTIATFNGSAGIPFQWASLDATHQALLNSPVSPPGTADGSDVLSYLRGNRLYEGTRYRTRGHVLGDIINAEPVILREPQFAYTDSGYASYLVQYKTTTPRTNVVFQAANDGMLHVFTAATGSELWAYVPGLMFNSRLSSTYPNTSQLVNLSLRSGFTHLYMVDGTPTIGDVDFGNTGGTVTTADWHAVLVGGLNKGGFGYYALDVTVPDKATAASTTALTEAQAAAKVLWEFPNASTSATVKANIGFSYGKPYITKTKAAGWVALVTSGYNNGTKAGANDTENSGGDGLGHLFVLNAQTGALIKDIPTTSGSGASPSGLGQIVGYSDNAYQDNTVKLVYGGDLNGNVWRFDLSGATTSSWKVDLLAQLVDGAGSPQPITTTPALAISNSNRMVFVGTGQYLGDADVSSTQTQSMYALIDSYDTATPLTAATISPLRSSLNQQQITGAGTTRTISSQTTVSSAKGWYVDLNLTSKERVITDPAIAVNTLVLTTNIPSSADPCKPGGSSWIYNIDFASGALVKNSTTAGTYLGDSLASRPILVKLPNGNIIALVRKSDATTASTSVATGGNSGVPKRVSWREIRQQQ